MGSYVTKCNLCKSVQISPSAAIQTKSTEKPTIKLLLLGLDNAGKTTIALHLTGDSLEDLIPTIGFSNIELPKFYNFRVVMYDLGGGSRIRAIWKNYFALIHGIIFVVDSADINRLLEVKDVLEEVVSNDKIAGKPILLFINKQDIEGALDELEICKYINVEPLITKFKCLTKIESCSAITRPEKGPKIDPAIDNGYQWLMSNIKNNWIHLNNRVETDSNEQYSNEKKSLEERIKRFRETNSETADNDEDLDLKSFNKDSDPFKPIKEVVEDIKKMNHLKTITEMMKNDYNEIQRDSYIDRSNGGYETVTDLGSEDYLTSDYSTTSLSQNEINETIGNRSEHSIVDTIPSPNKSFSPSKPPSGVSIVEIHHNSHQDIEDEIIVSQDIKDVNDSESLSVTSPQSSEKSLTSNRSHKRPKRKMKIIRNSRVSPVLSKSS